jgi:hypothetical protein
MKCYTVHRGRLENGICVTNGKVVLGDSLPYGKMEQIDVDPGVPVKDHVMAEAFFKKNDRLFVKAEKDQKAALVRIITYDPVLCPKNGYIKAMFGKVFVDGYGKSSGCSDMILTVFEGSKVFLGNLSQNPLFLEFKNGSFSMGRCLTGASLT